ncbi:MAG: S41 family peptidase [Planctomycetes bacterium]|nr:S41 family peptidase [Planctomycetota bacterium]
MLRSKLIATLAMLLGLMLLAGAECSGPLSDGFDGTDNGSNNDGDGSTAEALDWFDQVWGDFDEKYSYFIEKGIDWEAVRDENRPSFDQEMTAQEFVEAFSQVLQELHDWHVWIQAPDGDPLGYEGDYPTNYPPELLTGYATAEGYQTVGDSVIQHAWVGQDVAHILINTLDTTKWQAVTDDAIGNMFVRYQNAAGMIIDLRRNNGGNEDNAKRIASRLTAQAVLYGRVKTRNGPSHDDFDAPIDKTLEPSDRLHYEGPVVCLIGQRCLSSAEWFTLMMRAAGATLMGDRTRGGSGNPTVLTLDNGITYAISTWVAYTPGDEVIEDNGIAPDIDMAPEASFDADHDYLLETAIDTVLGLGG